MKPNKLRQLIKEGKPTLVSHSVIPWPRLVEIMAVTGAFDYIEYIGNTRRTTSKRLRTLPAPSELYPNMSMMIKVEEQSRGYIATRRWMPVFRMRLFADIAALMMSGGMRPLHPSRNPGSRRAPRRGQPQNQCRPTQSNGSNR